MVHIQSNIFLISAHQTPKYTKYPTTSLFTIEQCFFHRPPSRQILSFTQIMYMSLVLLTPYNHTEFYNGRHITDHYTILTLTFYIVQQRDANAHIIRPVVTNSLRMLLTPFSQERLHHQYYVANDDTYPTRDMVLRFRTVNKSP